jgi:hypothetical protein
MQVSDYTNESAVGRLDDQLGANEPASLALVYAMA